MPELAADRRGGGRVVAGDQQQPDARPRRTRGRSPARARAQRVADRRPARADAGRSARPGRRLRRPGRAGDGEHPQPVGGQPRGRRPRGDRGRCRRAAARSRTPPARPCRRPGSGRRGPRCTVVIRRVAWSNGMLGDPRPARPARGRGRGRSGRRRRPAPPPSGRRPRVQSGRSPSGGEQRGVVAQQRRPGPARRSSSGRRPARRRAATAPSGS